MYCHICQKHNHNTNRYRFNLLTRRNNKNNLRQNINKNRRRRNINNINRKNDKQPDQNQNNDNSINFISQLDNNRYNDQYDDNIDYEDIRPLTEKTIDCLCYTHDKQIDNTLVNSHMTNEEKIVFRSQ